MKFVSLKSVCSSSLARSASLILMAVLCIACSSVRTDAQASAACLIDRVIDGDTVVCADGTRVRLLLIDTPELDQGPDGPAARAALLALLPVGITARMEFDVQRLDRYGRTLAYLYTPDGRLANVEMARQGYAVSLTYPPNVRYVDEIRVAVAAARKSREGLWSTSAFACQPVQHRRGDCE